MDNWTKTVTAPTIKWIKFNKKDGGCVYIRQHFIEAFEDTWIRTSTDGFYPELVNVIETMEKS